MIKKTPPSCFSTTRYKVIFHLMKNVRGSCVLISTWSYSSEPSVAMRLSVKRLWRNRDEGGERRLIWFHRTQLHMRVYIFPVISFRVYVWFHHTTSFSFSRRSWHERGNVINAPTLTLEKYTLVSSMPWQPLISLARVGLSFWEMVCFFKKAACRILRWLFTSISS